MSDTHLDNWLADLDRQGRSSHTLAAYRRGIKHLLRWNQATYGTPLDVRELLARDLRDWIACQQTVEHAALATIAQRHQALRSFCTGRARYQAMTPLKARLANSPESSGSQGSGPPRPPRRRA